MGIRAKRLREGGLHRLARLALLLLCLSARPALPASAADWRYCYAGSDREHRFYVSRPFPTGTSVDAIEQQWIAWLARQALRYETTGCPRGADSAAVEAALGSAIRYNARQGRHASELDWQPTP